MLATALGSIVDADGGNEQLEFRMLADSVSDRKKIIATRRFYVNPDTGRLRGSTIGYISCVPAEASCQSSAEPPRGGLAGGASVSKTKHWTRLTRSVP